MVSRIDYVDLLTRLKSTIDRYEEILDLTKNVLNEVRAYGYSRNIAYMVRRLINTHNKLNTTLDRVDVRELKLLRDELGVHIKTLIQYIALVSIPYEEDLLKEIRGLLRDDSYKVMIDKAIKVSTVTREKLNNFI